VMRGIDGVTDLLVEPQVEIPQLRIELDRDKLELYGLTPVYVNEYVSTAMNGEVVSQVLLGQRTFDLLVRVDEKYREDMQSLRRLSIDLPGGGTTPLFSVARIYKSSGPNTINRELVRRRIVIQCNVSGRGLVDVVTEMQAAQLPVVKSLPAGYFVEYGGQFESERNASRIIGVLFSISMLGVLMVLYTMFRSVNFAIQVMAALPMAPNSHRCRDGRLHFARWHRFAKRHSAAQPLLTPRSPRRRNLVERNAGSRRQRTLGPRVDDGANLGYRIGSARPFGRRTGQRNPLSHCHRHSRRLDQ